MEKLLLLLGIHAENRAPVDQIHNPFNVTRLPAFLLDALVLFSSRAVKESPHPKMEAWESVRIQHPRGAKTWPRSVLSQIVSKVTSELDEGFSRTLCPSLQHQPPLDTL